MWDKIVPFERLIFEEIEFKNSSICNYLLHAPFQFVPFRGGKLIDPDF